MIGGVGFAVLAWRKAQRRVYGETRTLRHPPFPRDSLGEYNRPASREYYRMIDRAWLLWRARCPDVPPCPLCVLVTL